MAEAIYPGEQLGLPETGPGSLATIGRRAMAFVGDALVAAAVTWPFTVPELPKNWSLLSLFIIYTLATAFVGRTPGMAMAGIRMGSTTGRPVGLPRAVARTVLLMLVLPAVVLDGDRRGFHDKAGGTVVVNDR